MRLFRKDGFLEGLVMPPSRGLWDFLRWMSGRQWEENDWGEEYLEGVWEYLVKRVGVLMFLGVLGLMGYMMFATVTWDIAPQQACHLPLKSHDVRKFCEG